MYSNKDLFEKYFKDKFGLDMHLKLSETMPSAVSFDEAFIAKMNGF